ncbi:hypothetical protein Scep_020665 [Stephania cephalantha]|uniref:Acidic leucine-rich nuclear phosphoprotein 32-related protein n=1 Tax=Stephania cephalantha TaxID=152367 RepID=A0AAP0IE62_9MAGN
MDEIWERAVETALEGQADCVSARSLTLDGAVKCFQGRLPPSSLLEKYENLEHLSIANVGVSSLENFPRLRNLRRLILSDNRIAGGLEFLVEAELECLRDLDLSNNRIQSIEELAPLAKMKLVSLDLYECPVTRIRDYRASVFGLIRTLRYLDKMDVEENERLESDEEEEEEVEEDEEDDPGSGEIDGEDRSGKVGNGMNGGDGVYDVDEDEESDEDEEEGENVGVGNRSSGSAAHSQLNGSIMVDAIDGDENDDDEDDEDIDEDIDNEIDGEDRSRKVTSGINGGDRILDVDDDEEIDEDEEEKETMGVANWSRGAAAHSHSNRAIMSEFIDEDENEDDIEEDDDEIDGEDRSGRVGNGINGGDGVLDVDEDDESDEDEEEGETLRGGNRPSGAAAHSHSNGAIMAEFMDGDENDYVEDDEDDLGEEVNEEEGEDDDDVVEVHEIDDSGDEEDGVDDEEDESDEKEEVDTAVKSRLTSSEGEIDGHDYGEEDENDENGEIGEEDENDENGEVGEEEDQGVGEDAEFEEDDGEEDDESSEFLVQPVSQADKGSDFELNDGEGDSEEDIEDGEKPQEKSQLQPSSSHPKRKRGDESNKEDVDVVKSRKR